MAVSLHHTLDSERGAKSGSAVLEGKHRFPKGNLALPLRTTAPPLAHAQPSALLAEKQLLRQWKGGGAAVPLLIPLPSQALLWPRRKDAGTVSLGNTRWILVLCT